MQVPGTVHVPPGAGSSVDRPDKGLIAILALESG
jgi:hypothetical protein